MSIDRLIESLPSRSAQELRDMRTRATEWEVSEDVSKADAAKQLLAAMDSFEDTERESRLKSPLVERVVAAFRHRPWTDHERKLIQVLLDNPGATTTELNQAAGLGDNMVWQMHFGNMCKDRVDYLGEPPAAVTRPGYFWSGLLAEAELETNRFTMKADAAVGFQRLGLAASRLSV